MESLPSPDAAGESIEKQVILLFSDMLHQPDIRGTDNFLHLGGHSLTATRLLARVRSIFGVNVSLRNFFADPTPAGLAEVLQAARSEGGAEVGGAEVAAGERKASQLPLDALDPE